MPEADECESPVIVILVHGTWAPGSKWTQPDHDFTQNLIASIGQPCLVEAFEWRGWLKSIFNNSHLHRLQAGDALAELIESKAKDHPESPIFVVGHSHGGNVAVYAARSRPSNLAGIICLATPFISAGPAIATSTLVLTALGVIGLACWALGGLISAIFSRQLESMSAIPGGPAGIIAGALFIALLIPLVQLTKRYLAQRDETRKLLDSTELPPDFPVLCGSYKGDETQLGLNLLAVPRRIGIALLRPWTMIGCGLSVFVAALPVLWLIPAMRESGIASSLSLAGSIAGWTALSVFVVLGLLFLISSFLTNLVSFGFDASLRSLLYGLTVKRAPKGSVEKLAIDHPPRELLLRYRHSTIKYDTRIQVEVGKWIGQRARSFAFKEAPAKERATIET